MITFPAFGSWILGWVSQPIAPRRDGPLIGFALASIIAMIAPWARSSSALEHPSASILFATLAINAESAAALTGVWAMMPDESSRRWLSQHASRPLLFGLMAVALIGLFAKVADEMRKGDSNGFGSSFTGFFRGAAPHRIGPDWPAEGARDVTSRGGYVTLPLIVVLVAAIYLLLQPRRPDAGYRGGAVLHGPLLGNPFEIGFNPAGKGRGEEQGNALETGARSSPRVATTRVPRK